MTSSKTFIIKTDYFNQSWTWIKRTILFIILALVIFLWGFSNPKYELIGFLLVGIASIIVFSIPKDDLAVDKEYIYCIRKSILPFFSKTKKYEISKIKSVRCNGNYSRSNDLFNFLSLGNLYQSLNSIEINFKDNSSISLNVAIYKKELNGIILKVSELISS